MTTSANNIAMIDHRDFDECVELRILIICERETAQDLSRTMILDLAKKGVTYVSPETYQEKTLG